MKEDIKNIYYVENNELYVRTLFLNNEISNIKVDSIENILHKVKMFDEEYQELLKQNNLMMHISKNYEQLESNWNELKKWLEEETKDGRSEDNQWLMGCYDFAKDVLDKMKELDDKDEKDNSI